MQWPSLILTLVLVLALAQCTWMKYNALAVKLISLIALEALLSAALLSTHMQEYDVKVCKKKLYCSEMMMFTGLKEPNTKLL